MVKNILVGLDVLLNYYEYNGRIKYPDLAKVLDYLKHKPFAFVSSSSIAVFERIKYRDIAKEKPELTKKQQLETVHGFIKEFLSYFKMAKTPSYVDVDFDGIDDSLMVASAKAIGGLVLTKNKRLLQKYPDITISPEEYLSRYVNDQSVSMPTIDFANIKKQHYLYQQEIEEAIDRVYDHGRFIMGPEIEELEEKLCEFTGAKHAITCSSGTDALLLALLAIGIQPGDEVITTPFTFISTAETIALLGAKPVFVDIDEKTYNIDVNKVKEKITPKTKAIIAVSLFGQPCDLDELNDIISHPPIHPSTHKPINPSTRSPIYLIVDGAQSFGATYKGKSEVHFCDIYTTSFFPAKPLGCYGDGGAVLTNSDKLAEKIKMLRIHGQNRKYHHKYIGLGARLDTIQAAILLVKLKHYKEDLVKRQLVAKKYTSLFSSFTHPPILPFIKPDRTSVWAQYSIRVKNREQLQTKLKEAKIPTAIHYPTPLHLQECFGYLGYQEGDFPVAERVSKEIISLPMNPYLSDSEVEFVVKSVKRNMNL